MELLKDVRYCVRQRNHLPANPTEMLGIERKFKVFMPILKRGSVFNRLKAKSAYSIRKLCS